MRGKLVVGLVIEIGMNVAFAESAAKAQSYEDNLK